MRKIKSLLILFILLEIIPDNLMAQENIDLATQRKEVQRILKIPGEKRNHRGIFVNPMPHVMRLDTTSFLDVSGSYKLTIKQGEKQVKHGVKPLSGAYTLTIDKNGVIIRAYDERGAFYGRQTLEQLLESPAVKAKHLLPYGEINDYPDLPLRGVVEGFYGPPWAHETRLSLIDFYGRFKLNTYVYGPKDDPYHRTPDWRKPYPEKEARQITELVEACKRNFVDFVWAVHPGGDIHWNEDDFQNLLRKFGFMYDLGVRSFSIFFDDISGEGTDPDKQVEWLNRIYHEFVEAKGDVASLILCPTDYTKAWANPTEQGSLVVYGNKLHPAIDVFWTGDAVCSDVTRSTLDWVNSRIKRPALFWWNYPVTDYVRPILLQGPAYGLDTALSPNKMRGLLSNPMEHGEASKLALYGVADYSWNIADYNAIDNWERGLVYMAPECSEAYRTFAIHSGDTGAGYRRDESWETETFDMNQYTTEQYDALLGEFRRIEKVEAEMEAACNNEMLMKELRPWLREFTKLGIRGRKTLEILKLYEDGDEAAFWEGYVDNFISTEERKAYEAHKVATLKLQPFYENAMDTMIVGFYQRMTGQHPDICKGVGSYPNLNTPQQKLMFDGDETTCYTSATRQKTEDWVGVDLGYVKEIREIQLLQGRNSVDDGDYYDHATLEYSADGKEWKTLLDGLKKQYEIHWKAEPVRGRYVRLRKLPSAKRNWIAIRSFVVNPMKSDELGFEMQATDKDAALNIFDKNPTTLYQHEGLLSFEVKKEVASYCCLMKVADAPIFFRQYAADGSLLKEDAVSTHLFKLSVVEGATRVSIEGKAELYEIIPL